MITIDASQNSIPTSSFDHIQEKQKTSLEHDSDPITSLTSSTTTDGFEYEDIDEDMIGEEDREMLLEEEEILIDEELNLQDIHSISKKDLQHNDSSTIKEEKETSGLDEAEDTAPADQLGDMQNLRRKRVWSIDLGRFLELDDTSMGELTSQNEASIQASTKLPPLPLNEKQEANKKNFQEEQLKLPKEPEETPVTRERGLSFASILSNKDKDISLDPSFHLGRDRGLSFELFSFGMNEKGESIPINCISSNENISNNQKLNTEIVFESSRPRSDSHIFDSCIYTQGGSMAKEENSLNTELLTRIRGYSIGGFLDGEDGKGNESLHLASSVNPLGIVSSSTILPHPVQSSCFDHKEDVLSVNQKQTVGSTLQAEQFLDSHQTTTTSSSSTAQLSNQCQMELLNKGGRIGIYLPEERKARIAKFHSKRKLRIWRKRIKYDCRKKLADSRPRIKGRFVKRSDTST